MKISALYYPINVPAMILNVLWGAFFAWMITPVLWDMQAAGVNSLLVYALALIVFWGPPICISMIMGVVAGAPYEREKESDKYREDDRRMILFCMILASQRDEKIFKEEIRNYIWDRYDIRLSKKTLDARMAGLYLEGYIVKDGIFGYRLTEKGKNRFAIKEE